MKKINKVLLSAMLVGLTGQVFAQGITSLIANNPSVKNNDVSGYMGINYPKPLKTEKSSLGLNDLLSDKLTAAGAAAQKSEITELRKQAIIEIASALGASGGLEYRTKQRKAEFESNSQKLDEMYNFNLVIIDNGVLPAVLTEGEANYAQNSDDQVRISDKTYIIDQPAKFVSAYPTWRSYLKFSYPSYDMPDSAYLPKNDEEKAIWDKAIKEGWAQGISQANNISEASYARLKRDYLGMVKYQILLAEGLITPTLIAKQNLGVTGGGRKMSINDQIFRISDHSSLNPNKTEWKVEYPVSNNNGEMLK